MPPKDKRNARVDDDVDMMPDADDAMPCRKFFNVNYSAEFMCKLPERIRQRAHVLLHYHEEFDKLRREFEQKETALRRKYDAVYLPFYERRKEIVSGNGPIVSDAEVEKGIPHTHKGEVDVTCTEADAAVGVCAFWRHVLAHHVLSASLMETHDAAVLDHLVDIRSGVMDGEYGSFAVAFCFTPNPYFEEETLVLSLVQEGDNTRIIRTPITWKKGKDVTREIIEVKPSGKRRNASRAVRTKEVSRPSFFTIFADPKSGDGDAKEKEKDTDDEDADEADEQVAQLMHVLHNVIIPNAVNFYTGEAPDGSSDLETDDDDDEEEEEEEEEEEVLTVPRGRGGRGGAQRGRGGAQNAPECKQQ